MDKILSCPMLLFVLCVERMHVGQAPNLTLSLLNINNVNGYNIFDCLIQML